MASAGAQRRPLGIPAQGASRGVEGGLELGFFFQGQGSRKGDSDPENIWDNVESMLVVSDDYFKIVRSHLVQY